MFAFTVSEVSQVARSARTLRVPMSHTERDSEYLPVLAYRIDQELRALRNRERALVALASDVASLQSAPAGIVS